MECVELSDSDTDDHVSKKPRLVSTVKRPLGLVNSNIPSNGVPVTNSLQKATSPKSQLSPSPFISMPVLAPAATRAQPAHSATASSPGLIQALQAKKNVLESTINSYQILLANGKISLSTANLNTYTSRLRMFQAELSQVAHQLAQQQPTVTTLASTSAHAASTPMTVHQTPVFSAPPTQTPEYDSDDNLVGYIEGDRTTGHSHIYEPVRPIPGRRLKTTVDE
jgi:hypothetical protein